MTTRFDTADVANDPPAAGLYPATITSARWRNSAAGHRMLQIVYALGDVTPAYGCVAEYFVLEGASARGAATARRRLVEVYRACGMEPQPGESVVPSHLLGATLLVKIEHDEWNGRPRLRVAGHRSHDTEDRIPF